jgi:hypothetical protein
MGAAKQQSITSKSRKTKKKVRFSNSRGTFRISDIDAAVLADLLDKLVAEGCYIAVYPNSTRSNFAISIKHDDLESLKAWPTDEDELIDIAQAVIEALHAPD